MQQKYKHRGPWNQCLIICCHRAVCTKIGYGRPVRSPVSMILYKHDRVKQDACRYSDLLKRYPIQTPTRRHILRTLTHRGRLIIKWIILLSPTQCSFCLGIICRWSKSHAQRKITPFTNISSLFPHSVGERMIVLKQPNMSFDFNYTYWYLILTLY